MDDMKWLEKFLDESIPLWQENPVMFFQEVLAFEPDKWQAEAASDLAHNPKVSIKSGQGVGKTGLEAAIFLPVSRIQGLSQLPRQSNSSMMCCGRKYPSG